MSSGRLFPFSPISISLGSVLFTSTWWVSELLSLKELSPQSVRFLQQQVYSQCVCHPSLFSSSRYSGKPIMNLEDVRIYYKIILNVIYKPSIDSLS